MATIFFYLKIIQKKYYSYKKLIESLDFVYNLNLLHLQVFIILILFTIHAPTTIIHPHIYNLWTQLSTNWSQFTRLSPPQTCLKSLCQPWLSGKFTHLQRPLMPLVLRRLPLVLLRRFPESLHLSSQQKTLKTKRFLIRTFKDLILIPSRTIKLKTLTCPQISLWRSLRQISKNNIRNLWKWQQQLSCRQWGQITLR